MTQIGPRDQIELESLSPTDQLSERRRQRDDADYREWCETSFGMVELGSETIHPADVLDNCAADAARRGRADARQQIRVDTEQQVCEQFPATIAIPFHRFLEGPTSPLTRLYHLRDSWEALIRLLSALALAEAARIGSAFAPLELQESKANSFRVCKRRDLRSDKLSVRIGLIEGVLRRADQLNISMALAALLPPDVPAEIRRLNVIRNGFSHESAKSDKQAQELIDEAYPVLLELLVDLRDIREVELFRISKIIPSSEGGTVEVERLFGHAQSQRFRSIAMDLNALAVAMSAANVDGMHRVLARIDSHVFDLSPFLYAKDDESGHRTRLLEFKQRKDEKWHLECVADSVCESVVSAAHDVLLERFFSILEDGES